MTNIFLKDTFWKNIFVKNTRFDINLWKYTFYFFLHWNADLRLEPLCELHLNSLCRSGSVSPDIRPHSKWGKGFNISDNFFHLLPTGWLHQNVNIKLISCHSFFPSNVLASLQMCSSNYAWIWGAAHWKWGFHISDCYGFKKHSMQRSKAVWINFHGNQLSRPKKFY